MVCRGGPWPSRGVARDDASIVPYRGCNNAGFEISRVAANPPLAVGADSISARGTLRRRGFSGAVAAFSQICRAGVHARRTTAISKRNRSRRRRARRDEGIPPYGRPGGDGQPFWPQRLPWFAGCLRRRGVARDDASIVPYRGCNNAGFEISRVAANPPLDVGEGFIPPAGVRTAAGPGGMRASRPTAARVVTATLLAATFAMVRRGGHGPPAKPFPTF